MEDNVESNVENGGKTQEASEGSKATIDAQASEVLALPGKLVLSSRGRRITCDQ